MLRGKVCRSQVVTETDLAAFTGAKIIGCHCDEPRTLVDLDSSDFTTTFGVSATPLSQTLADTVAEYRGRQG